MINFHEGAVLFLFMMIKNNPLLVKANRDYKLLFFLDYTIIISSS